MHNLWFKIFTVWKPSLCPRSNKQGDQDLFVTLKLYGNDFRMQVASFRHMSRHLLFACFLVLLACLLPCLLFRLVS